MSSGRNPFCVVLNKAPFGVSVASFSIDVSTLLSNIFSTEMFLTFLSATKVSGEILYCIIKCGYSEFKSKDMTHLCKPTCGFLSHMHLQIFQFYSFVPFVV